MGKLPRYLTQANTEPLLATLPQIRLHLILTELIILIESKLTIKNYKTHDKNHQEACRYSIRKIGIPRIQYNNKIYIRT